MVDFRNHTNRILIQATRAFGESVTFKPKAGGTYIGLGIFDAKHMTIDPDTLQVISVEQPTLGINLNDFDFDPKQGDVVTIRDIDFQVTETKPDGLGGMNLLLTKVRASDRLLNTRAP